MALVDPNKAYIFIWVPGTMGHEVHPEFAKAVDDLVGDEAQQICVDYPALWDFEKSVPVGEENLKKVLRQVHSERREGQRVLVGGSSQGAWIISNVYNNTPYLETFGADDFDYRLVADKTVLFGHPGVAHSHDHHFEMDESIWEVNDLDDDAVTFGWGEESRSLVRAIVAIQRGKVWHLPVLVWAALRHPIRTFKLMYLIACAVGIVRWNTSPHDYSRQMPLAVYWLTN